jgi:hypothetical protein
MDIPILLNKITNYNGLIFFLHFLDEIKDSNTNSDENHMIIYDKFITYYIFNSKNNTTQSTTPLLIDLPINEKKKILISELKNNIMDITKSYKYMIDKLCNNYNAYCNDTYDISFIDELKLNIDTFLTDDIFKKYDLSYDKTILKNNIKCFISNYIISNQIDSIVNDELDNFNNSIGSIDEFINKIYDKKDIGKYLDVLTDSVKNEIHTKFTNNLSLKCQDQISILIDKVSLLIVNFLKQKQDAFNKLINKISGIKIDILKKINMCINSNMKNELICYHLRKYYDYFDKLICDFIYNISLVDSFNEKITECIDNINNYHIIFCKNIKINHIDIIIFSIKINTSCLITKQKNNSNIELFIFQKYINDIIYEHINQIKQYFIFDLIINFIRNSKIIQNIFLSLNSDEYTLIKLIRKLYYFDYLSFDSTKINEYISDQYTIYKNNIISKIDEYYNKLLLDIKTIDIDTVHTNYYLQSVQTSINTFIEQLINLKLNINTYTTQFKNNLSNNIIKYFNDLSINYNQQLNEFSYNIINNIYNQYTKSISNQNNNTSNIINFNHDVIKYLNLEFISNNYIELKKISNDINYFLYINNTETTFEKINSIFLFLFKSDNIINRQYLTSNFIGYLTQLNSILNKIYQTTDNFNFFDEYKKHFYNYTDNILSIDENEFNFPTKIISLKNKLIVFFKLYIDYNYSFYKINDDINSYKKLSQNDSNRYFIIASVDEYKKYLLNKINMFDFKIKYDVLITETTFIETDNSLYDNLLFNKFITNTEDIKNLSKITNKFFYDNYVIKYVIPIINILRNNYNFTVRSEIKLNELFVLLIK